MEKNMIVREVPENLYSLFSDAINAIKIEDENYYAVLPNKGNGYLINISKEDYEKIDIHWQNNEPVILVFSGGKIIKNNHIINSSYKIELNIFDKTEFIP